MKEGLHMVKGKTMKAWAFALIAILFVLLLSIHFDRLDAQQQDAARYVTTTKAADQEFQAIEARLSQFNSNEAIKAFETLGYERVLTNDEAAMTFSKVDPYLKQTTAVRITPADAHQLSRAIITIYDGDSNTLKTQDMTQLTQLETVLSWKNNH